MLKYQGKYQICQEYFKNINDKYDFTDNPDATFIVLKNKGEIYRYDNKTLALSLQYSTLIGSSTTEIKSPLKEILAELESKIKLVDTYLLDDGIIVYFKEKDLPKVISALGNKHGTYTGRANRYYKSRLNLPDFKFVEKKLQKIKNNKDYKKLNKLVKETSKRLDKGEPTIWTMLYNRLKKQLDLPDSIGGMARKEKVSPINIIDSQNWYKESFGILKEL